MAWTKMTKRWRRVYAKTKSIWLLSGFLTASCLAGCAAELRRPMISPVALDSLTVVGYDRSIRAFADAEIGTLERLALDFLPERSGSRTPQFLALSGGGARGAFGAGLLVGWTESGTRPSFDLVTGISAGALIAPFAFLGPGGDADLETIWASGLVEGIDDRRFILTGLLGQSIARGEPLQDLISNYVDEAFLARVAAEHQAGRRLHVITTNLDSQRSVMWNMGAIAASGRPDAAKLFRDILAASASIPGVFPAIEIEAEIDGQVVRELHGDGGAIRQVFLFPDTAGAEGIVPEALRRLDPDITLVVNGELFPSFEQVPNRTVPVATRALETLIKSGTRAAVAQIRTIAAEEGMGFRLAFIDEIIANDEQTAFNADYMGRLFEFGRRKGVEQDWDRTLQTGVLLAAQ